MPDFIMNGQAHGDVARTLQSFGDVGRMRPFIGNDGRPYVSVSNGKGADGKPRFSVVPVGNATLRKDEWKFYDTAVLKAAKLRMLGIADLQSRGLTMNLGNGMGKTVLEYENVSELSAAEMSMDGVRRADNDRLTYEINYLPLPIIHKDFQINARVLEASRTTGDPLDTAQAEECGMKVAEKAETLLFQGSSNYSFGGGTIYGYTDFPSRNQGSLTGKWDYLTDDSDGTVGEKILSDVVDMKQALIDDRHYGPYVLYIPTNYETTLDKDFKSASDKTIRQRLLEVSSIEDVKVADYLDDDDVVMVQMTNNVVRLVTGLGISTVEWKSEGGMVYHYKVMTIMVPQLRADANGRCGIAHYSG